MTVSEEGIAAARAQLCELRARYPELDRVRLVFDLTELEFQILVLAFASEVDHDHAANIESLRRVPGACWPTVGIAHRIVGGGGDQAAVLAALAPEGRLQRFGLVDLGAANAHSARELRLRPGLWPRLVGISSELPFAKIPLRPLASLRLVRELGDRARDVLVWMRSRHPRDVMIAIRGPQGTGRTALAGALSAELGIGALHVSGAALDHETVRDICREAVLDACSIVIDGIAPTTALADLSLHAPAPLFVVTGTHDAGRSHEGTRRAVCELAVTLPDVDARAAIWTEALHREQLVFDGEPGDLAARFRFGPGRIHEVARAMAASRAAQPNAPVGIQDVVASCRHADASTSLLARRLDDEIRADQLVIPVATRQELDLLTLWARHSARVFRPGGPGARVASRPGIVAMFVGPPGTGKTLAAQVIARELACDVLRVDLSQVVNKYIGETEKNLERVFEAAETEGALLFFDEADALFGRRTDVRDAHDRYANLETAFLLQRLEMHRGVVVLATNLQQNVDPAFLRRIQIIAEFPLPGPAERLAIWQRHVDASHLADDVDLSALAQRFTISGGDVRNAVVTAVLLAAEDGERVAMRHLVRGLWREMRKAGRMISGDEFGPWADVLLASTRERSSPPAHAS